MPGLSRAAAPAAAKATAAPDTGVFALFPPAALDDCYVRLNADSLHDLMSPVNQIGTLTDLLLKKYRGSQDPDAETLLEFLQGSANRLQDLIAGLRTYVRVAGSPGPGRLSDANLLLAGAQATIQAEIDRNGAVITHDPLPELYCDPHQIGYAFASLLENAIKFNRDRPPRVHVSAAAVEQTWVFSVQDNGIGIDPTQKERIFGLFKRFHGDSHSGAGVGLAVTRQIVEQHGGRIWVESQPGGGATFYFSLRRGR